MVTFSIQGFTVSEGTSIGGTFRSGDVIFFCGSTLIERYHLLQILMGNKPPSRGVVTYNEQNLHNLDPKQKAKMQDSDFAFFAGNDLLLNYLTIVENCLVSERHITGITIERTKILLRRLGFQRPETIYPNQLSLPQRRLVALARCLRKDPKVIFAYEPFSDLSSEEASMLWNGMVNALTDRDVILIGTAEEPLNTITTEAITFSLNQ